MKNQANTLKINSTDGYLHLEDLPHNCIFNKVITGCGGTTIAITNSENYVIAVPTKELIVNKIGKAEAGESDNKNLFGLFGEFTNSLKSKLKKYLKKDGVKKIICTYDKLAKLAEYLNPADFRLLVDEYHCLLKAYSYRDTAIDGVLDSFKQYKSFCFMSATPIQAEFSPSCLNGVPVIVADWSYTDTLIVSLEKTNHPYQKASNYIKAYKRDSSTCTFTIRDEYPHLLGVKNEDVREQVELATRYIYRLLSQETGQLEFRKDKKLRVAYHTPCHMEKLGWAYYSIELLKSIPNVELVLLDSQCCGIAGTYGFKKENYKTSQDIGNSLFKQIEESGVDYVVTDCETCKWQIEMSTSKCCKHPISVLAEMLQD